MSEEKNNGVVNAETAVSDKSPEQEEWSNLHPLRGRLYGNIKLSLTTMNIVVAVVAILLVAVFFYGVFTGTGINLN